MRDLDSAFFSNVGVRAENSPGFFAGDTPAADLGAQSEAGTLSMSPIQRLGHNVVDGLRNLGDIRHETVGVGFAMLLDRLPLASRRKTDEAAPTQSQEEGKI